MTDTTRREEKLPGQNRCLALNSISRLGLDEKQEKDPRATGIHGGTDGVAGPFHFIHGCHGGGHCCSYFVAAVQFNNSNFLGTRGEHVVLCVRMCVCVGAAGGGGRVRVPCFSALGVVRTLMRLQTHTQLSVCGP